MTDRPLFYADFHNADSSGRLRLNCIGTTEDLARLGLVLRDGLLVRLHDEELEADGIVRFDPEHNGWVAEIDWQAIRNGIPAPPASPGTTLGA